MTLQKIEIEVDIPDGWEAVGYGIPNYQPWLTHDGQVCERDCAAPRIILRKKFDVREWWPKWLKAKYVARNASGQWMAFAERPSIQPRIGETWVGMNKILICGMFDFTPPEHITDWRESLIENPFIESEGE